MNRTPFLVAAAMFVACIGIGSVTGPVLQQTVSWLAGAGGNSRAALQFSVSSGVHAMRIRNLTDRAWAACVVTVDGGFASPSVAVKPRATLTIPYAVLSRREGALDDREGFGRAFRSTAIECADRNQQREYAILR